MAKTDSPVYGRWIRIRKLPHDPAWDKLENFEAWALASGFEVGDKLMRRDSEKPYGPDNCEWVRENLYGPWTADFIERWNKTVNVFRKAAGLSLLGKESKPND